MSRWRRQQRKRARAAILRDAELDAWARFSVAHPVQAKRLLREYGGSAIRAVRAGAIMPRKIGEGT